MPPPQEMMVPQRPGNIRGTPPPHPGSASSQVITNTRTQSVIHHRQLILQATCVKLWSGKYEHPNPKPDLNHPNTKGRST